MKYIIEDFDKLSIYDGLNVLRIINTLLISLYKQQQEDTIILDIEEFFKQAITNTDDNKLFEAQVYLTCLLNQDDFKTITNLFYYEVRGQKLKLTNIKDVKIKDLLIEFVKEGYRLLNSQLFQ
jgi:hypothetical protein